MSARGLARWLLLCLLLPGGSWAASRSLKGRVVLEEGSGETRGASGVTVILTATGDRDVTDSSGVFRIYLSEKFRPGETVNLSIELNSKKGWRLYSPLDGNVSIPADPDKQLSKLVLLPAGSKKFLTDEGIEKFLKNAASEARAQAIRNGQTARIDVGRSIKDWAEAYGLDANQARAEVNKWVDSVEKRNDDTEKLALAAFAKGDFSRASEMLGELAQKTDQQLEQKLGELKEFKAKSIRQHESAGDADYNDKAYTRALANYESALKYISREAEPHHWATLMLSVAAAHVSQGQIDQGAAITQHFEAARAVIESILEVCTRQQMPQDWARAQNSLGNLLLSQGERAGRGEALPLMAEAVKAYHAALEVRTREQLPLEWATTQNHLGNALLRQGERAVGEEAVRLLGEAVGAYQTALEVRTREQVPLDWATTQSNLAIALMDQGTRVREQEEAARLLREADSACHAALGTLTREQFPQEWASAQNILGNVLLSQGERAQAEEAMRFLGESAQAYRAALEVRTREHLPQVWAMTQSNLGNALRSQGNRAGRAEALPLLGEAVRAYRSALEVITREQLPQPWATIQNNLGNALQGLGDRVTGAEAVRLLEEAASAYHAALDVFGDKGSSPYWKPAHDSLVSTRLMQAETLAASGSFTDMERVLLDVARDSDVDASTSINLRVLELLPLLTSHRLEAIPPRIDALVALVRHDPNARGRAWARQELRDRVRTDSRLAPFQGWLPKLIEAVHSERQGNLLLALYESGDALSRR